MSVKATVIVLVWNGDKFLDACLSALLSQQYEPFEVIVVDNASTDGSVAAAQRYSPPVRIIRNTYNLGYSGGNNVGIRNADGEIVILLNQDTVVQSGWLHAIADTFEDPSIGIVGCKALYVDGLHLQHAGAIVRPDDAFAFHRGWGEVDNGQYDVLMDPDYVTGAAFAIHRRTLRKLGGLDEQFYPAFYEEIDYCYRARRAGFRVVYQPRAILYHHETASLPANSYERGFAFHRNRIRFVLRHWDVDSLESFASAERQAIEATSTLGDAIARARAYWDNIIAIPLIASQRKRDATLGPPLTKSQVLALGESLRSLRQTAHQRISALMMESTLENGTLASPAETSSAAMMTLPETGKKPFEAIDLSKLEALVQTLEAQQVLREGSLASKIPVLGPLIARLRVLWISLGVRRFISPALRQQSALNTQVNQALRETMQLLATLQRQNEALAQQNELLRRQTQMLAQQNQEATRRMQVLKRLQDILNQDEAALPSILQAVLDRLEQQD